MTDLSLQQMYINIKLIMKAICFHLTKYRKYYKVRHESLFLCSTMTLQLFDWCVCSIIMNNNTFKSHLKDLIRITWKIFFFLLKLYNQSIHQFTNVSFKNGSYRCTLALRIKLKHECLIKLNNTTS